MGLFPPWFFDIWTPKRLPGLQLWLRADLGRYQDSAFTTAAGVDGDPVGGWRDQSGHGNHPTQATAGNRLVLNRSAIGGQPSLVQPTFSTAAYLNLPASLAVDRQAHSWFFVGRSRSMANGSSRCPVSFNSGLTDLMAEFTTTTGTQMRLRTWGTAAQTAAIWGRSGLTVLIVTATASGVTVRVNGEQATLSAYTAGTMTGGTLGKRQDNFPWAGELYEFGVWSRGISASESTALETYAVRRYGRPLSPPKELVLTGDSLTEGRNSTNQRGWPWDLDNALGATWQSLSMGRDGAYLGLNAVTLVTEATNLAATFRASKSKHVAICAGGTNDLGAGAQPATTVLGYAQSWLNTMKAAGWYTIMVNIAKRDDVAWSPAKETERLSYNAGLAGLSNLDAVVDIASLSVFSNPSDLTYYQSDKLHWTDASFAVVAATIQSSVLTA